MVSSGTFWQQTSKVLEASDEIDMLIAKSEKSHNIGETLTNQVYCVQQSSFWGRTVQISFPKSLYQTILSREGSMKCLKTLKIKFSTKYELLLYLPSSWSKRLMLVSFLSY